MPDHYCINDICTGSYYVKGSSRKETYHNFKRPGKCSNCNHWAYDTDMVEGDMFCENNYNAILINRYTPGGATDCEVFSTAFMFINFCDQNYKGDKCKDWHTVLDAYVDCDGGGGFCDDVKYKELDCNTPVSPNYVCIEVPSSYKKCETTKRTQAGKTEWSATMVDIQDNLGYCVDPDESKIACEQPGYPNHIEPQGWHWIERLNLCCGDDPGEVYLSEDGKENCCLEGDTLDEYGNCVR